MQGGNGVQRLFFAALLQDPLANFKDDNRWNDELRLARDRRFKEAGVRPVGEILEPGGGIDQVHGRSASRGTRVSMPRKNPRIFFASRTGISSMRPRQ